MLDNDIKPNQKVRIAFVLNGKSNEIECLIKEVLTDRITLYFDNEIALYSEYLQEGDDIDVSIFTTNGIKKFNALIIDSPFSGDFIIEYSDDITFVQRRKYMRVNLQTKVIIQRQGENIIAKTIDVSAGAIKFTTDKIFKNEELVKSLIYLPKTARSISAEGIILKKEHLAKDEYVLLFTQINDIEKNYINDLCLQIKNKSN